MKLFIKLNLALFLLLLGLNTFTFGQSNFLITPDSVGSLKIGMTVAEARRALPRHTFSRTSDGEGIALIDVKINNRTDFYLYANEFDSNQPIDNNAKIVFVEIINSQYRTEKGVTANMTLAEVERRYGKLQSIVLSEIESREYARFAEQPLGIDLKVANRNGQAGIYANGENRTAQYSRNSYVASIILLGTIDVIDTDDGDGTTVEMGFTSKYTNLETQCETPDGQDGGGHISTFCEGYGGYRVHIFDTATTMEINIQSNDESESVGIASQSLNFDTKGKQIEWRFKDGEPFAVIMRVDEYRKNTDGTIRYPLRKTGEHLVVKGLPGFEQIDFKVNTRTTTNLNDEARRLADEGFGKTNTTNTNVQNLDIASYNRTISNAARQNQAWVKSPMEVAVKLAGEFTEMRNRLLEMQYPSAESNDSMTLIITNEGLLDDSVRAEKIIFDLRKDSRGVWSVNSAQKSWSCHQGRGHQDFSAVPCR